MWQLATLARGGVIHANPALPPTRHVLFTEMMCDWRQDVCNEAPQRYGSIILHLPPDTLLLFSFCQLLVTQIKMEIVNFLSLIINKIIQSIASCYCCCLQFSSVQRWPLAGLRMLNNNTRLCNTFLCIHSLYQCLLQI